MISGCASTAEPIDPYVQQLQWLDAADPQADANQAVKQNDLRLLGLATRSVNIPGIEKKDLLKYEEVCGVQLIEGISDVVRKDLDALREALPSTKIVCSPQSDPNGPMNE